MRGVGSSKGGGVGVGVGRRAFGGFGGVPRGVVSTKGGGVGVGVGVGVGRRAFGGFGGGFGGGVGGGGVGTQAFRLLALPNVLAFGAWQFASATDDWRLQRLFMDNFFCSELALHQGRVWTFVTAPFMHTGAMHFLFNMVCLHSFVANVAYLRGEAFAVALCVVGGVASCVAHVGWEAAQRHRRDLARPRFFRGAEPPSATSVIGASGGVLALAAFTAAKEPHARASIIFAADLARALRLPALERLLTPRLRVLLGLFAALELGGALGVVPWETVPHAHAGHLGGLALGALMGML